MVKCPKCGIEVKYVPLNFATMSAAIVETEYTEIIQDNGRVAKGHLRHKCPENKEDKTNGNVPK